MESKLGTDAALIAEVVRLVEPYLAASGHQSGSIRNDVDLREVGVTSLQLVEIVLDVDARFSLSLEEESMTPANFRSVESIVKLIKSRVAESSASTAHGEVA